jgi:hypothetical protein
MAAVGGYVLVVATALPALGLTLTSSYLGALRGDTAAAHLWLAPGSPPALVQRVLPRDRPGADDARACLLDHAAELQAAVADRVGETVKIDIAPSALEQASGVWKSDDDPPTPTQPEA